MPSSRPASVRKYKSTPIAQLLAVTVTKPAAPIHRLTAELAVAYKTVSLMDDEMEMRRETFARYKRLLETEMNCVVEPFGSYRTGTMVHGSDIDMTILIKDESGAYDASKSGANAHLARIESILARARYARGSIVHLKKARTPILKLTDSLYGHSIDISINKRDGIETAEFILAELRTRPQLKPFVVLLKYFMKRRGLSDTSMGGLCAYGQFLLILHFAQMHPLVQNANISIADNLGVLFMDFFQFYGADFPYERSTISVARQCYRPNSLGSFSIEDPISEGNNVAAGCTALHYVKEIFLHCYKIMAAAIASRPDPRRGLCELWIRIDPDEMQLRQSMQQSRHPQTRNSQGH